MREAHSFFIYRSSFPFFFALVYVLVSTSHQVTSFKLQLSTVEGFSV